MRITWRLLRVTLLVAGALSAAACGGDVVVPATAIDPSLGVDASALDAALAADATTATPDALRQPDAAASCVGLRCRQPSCATGSSSVSGTVFAPNGKLPLYNVIVFVPNAELEPLSRTVSCSQCGVGVSGAPIVTTLSDYQGHFKLDNVPVGENVPLVFQVGKWRRKVVLPRVLPCVDNPIADAELTRLPKSRKEGDMPHIAVTTGECDKIACLLPKLGVDASEFGNPADGKAVAFYAGGSTLVGSDPWLPSPGASPWSRMPAARKLWNDPAELRKYDLAMFSCECDESHGNGLDGASKDPASFEAVRDYLDEGGRIFTTDFQYTWYKYSPDRAMSSSAPYPGGANASLPPVTIDTSFPKGRALAEWLHGVYPQGRYGEVALNTVFANLGNVDPKKVQVWGRSPDVGDPSFPIFTPAPSPRFITINTPVGLPAEQQCGKAVHLDAHISETDTVDEAFPAGCASELSEGEAAFAFFFFDLASCIQAEDKPPVPPPIVLR